MSALPRHLKRNMHLLDVHSHVGVDPLLYLTHGFPYCMGLREAFESNRHHGISHAVIFPWVTSLYYKLSSLQKGKIELGREIGNAPFHFENEQMLRQLYEIFPAYRSHFIPFAIVDTLRETKKQVKILDKLLSEFPFYGLKVHPRATQAHVKTLLREGKPLLEFAEAHDLPILIHGTLWPLDALSQFSDILDVARSRRSLRFCAAHFCGFHQALLEEADRMENVWVDSAAMTIGCELVRKKSKIYESGNAKIPADYRNPANVFSAIAHRIPDTFLWGSDNPAHTFINMEKTSKGKIPLKLWSSLQAEIDLLGETKGKFRKKTSAQNALAFIEGY